jgi:hypothetical protein
MWASLQKDRTVRTHLMVQSRAKSLIKKVKEEKVDGGMAWY